MGKWLKRTIKIFKKAHEMPEGRHDLPRSAYAKFGTGRPSDNSIRNSAAKSGARGRRFHHCEENNRKSRSARKMAADAFVSRFDLADTHVDERQLAHLSARRDVETQGGDMRIVLTTEKILAVAFRVPIAEFHTSRSLLRSRGFNRLGPSILDAQFWCSQCQRILAKSATA